MTRFAPSLVSLTLLAFTMICSAQETGHPEPKLISVFPLGGQRGSTIQVEVFGRGLDNVDAAWFECDDVRAVVKDIEPLKDRESDKPVSGGLYKRARDDESTHRVAMEVAIDKDASLGLHGLRLVGRRGMSNALPLQVTANAVVTPNTAANDPEANDPEKACLLKTPIVVNGRLESKGQVDWYAFDATVGQSLRFEVFSNLKPGVPYRAKIELALYERSGSWFDPQRLNRIQVGGPALSWAPIHSAARWFDERSFNAGFVLFPRLTHRFPKEGRYLVSVSTFLGAGTAGHFYQLRITDSEASRGSQEERWFGRPAHADPGDWLERDSSTLRQWGSFTRKLKRDRLKTLQSRSVKRPSDPVAVKHVCLQAEAEPNDAPEQSLQLSIPSLVEGVIQQPGDRDFFTFEVTQGQKLALEIETPRAAPPVFNPWIKVRDATGQLLFTNIYREYGGDGDDVNKCLERKTLYTFDRAAVYQLEVRDLTSRVGGPQCAYRLLVRRQAPHLGRIETSFEVVSKASTLVDMTDHINLVPGRPQEIVVVVEREEGFDGQVALGAKNLPEGVEMLAATPASWTEPLLRGFQYRPLDVHVMDPKNYRAQRQPLTLVLFARPEAPAGQLPRMVTFTARPIVDGRPGQPLPSRSFPLMVVAP